MALTKVINDLADLNQSGSTNALKGCVGTTAQQPTSSSNIEYLIVGGGGGNGTLTGGAGAGGLLTGTTTVYQGIPAMLTIGEGGPAGPASYPDPLWARNGDDSGFNGIRALGGGSGGGHGVSNNGIDGGSGGGATSSNSSYSGGLGTTGQGMGGGANSTSSTGYGAGGGGGAGNPAGDANGTGGSGTSALGGTGGCGTNMSSFISSTNANLAQIGDVSGSDVFFAGGGGGGIQEGNTGGTPFGGPSAGVYANGGGGHGAGDGNASQAGLRNTGGGAGGPGYKTSLIWGAGADGGSGVAVLKYNNTEVTGYTLNSEDTYTVNWPADKYGVAYWPLNLDVKDVGGNYDGTATDVTYVTGKFNQAASFNGTSSIIQATQPAQGKDFTLSAWVKTSASGAWNIAIGMGASLTNANGVSMWISGTSDSLYAQWGNGSSEDYWGTLPTTVINSGEWVHIAITVNNIDSPTVKGYINGVLEGSGTNAGSPVAITYEPNDFTIGGRKNTAGTLGQYWDGEIEQVRFYGSELSITDVQDIYNNSKPGSLPPLTTTITTTTCNFPNGVTGTALYQFENNADDSCTVGPYNGSFTNSAYTIGKFGDCAEFNGSNAQIEITDGGIGNNSTALVSFSISIWIKTSSSSQSAIINDYTTYYAFYIQLETSGKLTIGNHTTGSASSLTGNAVINDGNWHHLVLINNVSNNTQKLYIDSYLDINNTLGTGTKTAQSIFIGNYSGLSFYYNGLMDQLRFYNVALTDQNVYDLWQKETNIQTHFSSTDPADTTPANTDILVFKEGSGEITFKNDSPPGAEVGMLRTNTDLFSANSTSGMEHFTSGGWKDFTNCTNSVCSYPVSGSALYQFNNNSNDTCGNYNATAGANITYIPSGNFGKAANFPGNLSTPGDGIILPSSLSTLLSNNYSISIWFNADDFATGCIGGCGNYPTLIAGFDTVQMYFCVNPTPVLRYYNYGAGAGLNGTTTLSTNTWYHTVLTQSSTDGAKIYLNGVLESSDSSMTANAGTLGVGQNLFGGYDSGGGFDLPWDGLMDQIRIYSSVLTPEQVTQVYNEIYCP